MPAPTWVTGLLSRLCPGSTESAGKHKSGRANNEAPRSASSSPNAPGRQAAPAPASAVSSAVCAAGSAKRAAGRPPSRSRTLSSSCPGMSWHVLACPARRCSLPRSGFGLLHRLRPIPQRTRRLVHDLPSMGCGVTIAPAAWHERGQDMVEVFVDGDLTIRNSPWRSHGSIPPSHRSVSVDGLAGRPCREGVPFGRGPASGPKCRFPWTDAPICCQAALSHLR